MMRKNYEKPQLYIYEWIDQDIICGVSVEKEYDYDTGGNGIDWDDF